jgi:hypothetical protein
VLLVAPRRSSGELIKTTHRAQLHSYHAEQRRKPDTSS